MNEVQSTTTSTTLMHSNTDNEVQLMFTQSMHSNINKLYSSVLKLEFFDNKPMQLFEEYKSVLLNALKIVQEQENANNIQ
ncbi:23757_t:CDS:2 [Racocetra persica]|uniref:23757_t:CDS:1 n=1 Tax=Racocetra persica TaxID=160502 RepID=A0ACA9KEL9_9GLOM|nr:23757_t:CDS:2 [Racocetra persica]